MPLYQVVILAIIQGITEFLPVSSSAHLALAPWLFGWKDPGLAFDVALHLGTLVAVIIYFFRDWLQVIAHGFGLSYGSDSELRRNPKLLWLLAIASVPVGLFGFLFQKQAEHTLRNPYIIGGMLIGVGLLMAYADRFGSQRKEIDRVSLADALAIGGAQALAIIPGTSRSGITITAGMFRDLNRYTAARFSFLLSTPAIGAAGLKAVYDLQKHEGGLPADERTAFLVGIVVSGLVGSVVIGFFMRYLQRFSLRFFVIYRVLFGLLVIALAAGFHYTAE